MWFKKEKYKCYDKPGSQKAGNTDESELLELLQSVKWERKKQMDKLKYNYKTYV